MSHPRLPRALLKLVRTLERKGLKDDSIESVIQEALSRDHALKRADGNLRIMDIVRLLRLMELSSEELAPPRSPELTGTLPGFSSPEILDTRNCLYDMVDSATKSLLIFCYDLSERGFIERLHRFHSRPGTCLRIIANHGFKLSDLMASWPYTARPDEVEALEYIPRFDQEYASNGHEDKYHPPMHAKAIVADERSCYLGSANFTAGGLKHNVELGVYLDDSILAAMLWNLSKSFPSDLLRNANAEIPQTTH